jgi:hypothetical protein
MTETKCILHVGTEKTGSTSLQRFLAMNANVFQDRGIWLPRALVHNPDQGPYNHMLITTANHLSLPEPDDLQSALGLSSMDMVQSHRIETIKALEQEFAALSAPPNTIIISSEHIQSRLQDKADLHNVKAMLQPFCTEFRVVVYLRSQQDMARSVAVTALRNGATEFRQIPDFSSENGFDPVLGVDFGYFDHAALLARLEAIFGADCLDVRLYESGVMHEDDIIDDFFVRLKIGIAGLPRPGRENTSLSQSAITFLMKFNKYLPAHANAELIRERILSCLAITSTGHGCSSPLHEAAIFASQFDTVNEAVRTKWFPERAVLFAEDVNDHMKISSDDISSEAETFNLFIKLFDCIVSL